MIESVGPAVPRWLTDMVATLGGEGVISRAEQLRSWGASEVWRIDLSGSAPRSVIIKRGSGAMAAEARRYRQLVIPLALPAPQLLAATGGEGTEPVVLALQDVGRETLEQRPGVAGYRAAVRDLAKMRASATRRVGADPSIAAGQRMTTADFIDSARRAADGLAALRPDLAGSLDGPAQMLGTRLSRLADEPPTIVHGDFAAKNVMPTSGGRTIVIDWPSAYLHAHLGDLYLLLRDADRRGLTQQVDATALPEVFAREAGVDIRTVLDRMITGGLCWTVLTLRWLLDEGIRVIPESRDWIDELVAECRSLALSGGADSRRGRGR